MEITKYKLSELLTIKNGKDYKHLEEGNVPVFGSGGYMCSVNDKLYDKVSILLPRKGTLTNIQYYNSGAFWTVDTCFYSIVNERLADAYYLYRYLKSLDLSGYDTGASIPSMTQKTYNSIKINLPSLPTQRKIASILSAYDSLIECNSKRIRLLEQMAENLYKEWFVRFRFPGHQNSKMINGLPEGWKYENLGNVCKISSGGDYPKEYSLEKTKDYSIPIYSNGISKLGLYGFTNKAVIFNESVTISARGTVGFVCLRTEPYMPIVRLICLESDCVSMKFLYYQLLNMKIEGNGTSQQQLTIPMVNKMKIIIPPTGLTEKFDNQIVPLYKEMNKLAVQKSLLTRQRDLLLPRLMSGKLEVCESKINQIL